MFLFLRLTTILFVCFLALPGKADILDNTQKVSLIFVGPAKGLSESSFGHVALKLSPDKDGGLLDMVIEFVADIPRGESAVRKYVRGAGIGKKYPVKADLSPFYDYRKRKTINENRSLTVYDLKLSQEEIDHVVDFIQDYQNREVGENYLFLTKNCSYFAAHALEVATGKKFNNKNFPWKVGGKLKAQGLVTDENKYPDASSERERLGRRFIADGVGASFPAGWRNTFISMLGERSINLRQSSYLKLLWLLNKENVPEREKKKAQSLIRYLLTYENDVNQFTVRNLFKNPENKIVLTMPLIRLEGADLPKAKSIKHDLVLEDNLPVIKISWGGEAPTRVNVPLSPLKFSEDLSLSYQDKNVGRFIRTKSDRWILSQRLDYGIDIGKDENIVRTFLYIDLSENVKSLKLDFNTLKSSGTIALNNSLDFKGEAGSCYALALLQKALLERAIFVPQVTPKSEADKLLLLRELFNGKYVVIAGFKNISDFTSSIPKEDLKTFIRTLQAGLQKGRFAQMRESILEREILDQVTIPRLKAMLDEGLNIPLVIGMSEKGKLRPASDYAHVILVHDMKEIPEGHRITAYDPNTGLNSLFVLNSKKRLDYPFYDKKYDYVGVIDRITPETLTLDHAVRSRGIDLQKVRPLLQNTSAIILEPTEITRILP
ncbi:MAG: DUF4105 domain-containing protein [Bdellovibrionota bacterium]